MDKEVYLMGYLGDCCTSLCPKNPSMVINGLLDCAPAHKAKMTSKNDVRPISRFRHIYRMVTIAADLVKLTAFGRFWRAEPTKVWNR